LIEAIAIFLTKRADENEQRWNALSSTRWQNGVAARSLEYLRLRRFVLPFAFGEVDPSLMRIVERVVLNAFSDECGFAAYIRAFGGPFSHRLAAARRSTLYPQSFGNQNAIKRVEEPLH
jgi:hypothetical protein